MNEEDWFARFEKNIKEFVSRWWIPIWFFAGITIVVFSISIIVTLIFGTTGAGLYEQNLTERYGAHLPVTSEYYVPDSKMDNWNNIVAPLVRFSFGVLTNTTTLLLVGYIISGIYILVRMGYRRHRNRIAITVME